MSRTVDIPVEVKDALKKFRFSSNKGTAAISVKIVKTKLVMEVDEEYKDMTIEEIAEELPENSPRYVLLSHELVSLSSGRWDYKPCTAGLRPSYTVLTELKTHKDGRKSFPLLLINWAPSGCPTDLMTLHASSLSYFQQTAEVAKILEVRDGEEGLTLKAVEDRLLA